MYKIILSKTVFFFLFFCSSCSLNLYELPPDIGGVGIKKDNSAVIEELKKIPKLEIKKSDSNDKRLVRRDLQKHIDEDWESGREYIGKLDINTYASDEKDNDGLLMRPERLSRYPGVPAFSPKAYSDMMPGHKLSFIHLSDVQLHDERVYMFSKELTAFFDKFVQSFTHKPNMVLYDHSYYLTLIGTINVLCDKLEREEKLRPAFMMHTGDSIDAGVVSELYEFVYITNRLRIPWYNVIGNHDYPVYGNVDSKEIGVIRPDMGFQTVNSRHNFINMHGRGFDVDHLVYFSPDNAPHDKTRLKKSIFNGFDFVHGLPEQDMNERENDPCKDCPGYYYFEALRPQNNESGILCIVLDTTTKDFKMAKGTVYRHKETDGIPNEGKKYEQINWLKNVLETYQQHGKWMVFVFGHHPLDDFFDDSNKELFEFFHTPEYNVIAYFCGHTHKHSIRYYENNKAPGTFGFWEITADSIFEYPKRGSLVNIFYTGNGKWEIRNRGFWPYFLNQADRDAPELLVKAKKCFDASMEDEEGRKLVKRFEKLDQIHHDVVLDFVYPKTK